MRTTYDTDFFAWTQDQAALLRAGALQDLDLEHLAEEIESLGKSDRRILGGHLTNLLVHLLTWQSQPRATSSWCVRIRHVREDIADILDDSPSLRPQIPDLLPRRYQRARADASDETGLSLATFPPECPWSVDDLLRDDFWPEG